MKTSTTRTACTLAAAGLVLSLGVTVPVTSASAATVATNPSAPGASGGSVSSASAAKLRSAGIDPAVAGSALPGPGHAPRRPAAPPACGLPRPPDRGPRHGRRRQLARARRRRGPPRRRDRRHPVRLQLDGPRRLRQPARRRARHEHDRHPADLRPARLPHLRRALLRHDGRPGIRAAQGLQERAQPGLLRDEALLGREARRRADHGDARLDAHRRAARAADARLRRRHRGTGRRGLAAEHRRLRPRHARRCAVATTRCSPSTPSPSAAPANPTRPSRRCPTR